MFNTNTFLFFIFFISFFFINKKFLIKTKNLQYSNSLKETIDEVECPQNCMDTCDNETLKCDSCKNGYYSEFCDKPCVKYCEKCEQETGVCTECDSVHSLYKLCCIDYCKNCDENECLECEATKYGTECEDCPDTCNSKDYGDRMCDQKSGKCTLCVKGKKGDKCNENCNEGCDLEKKNCDQNDGKCECKNGYFGETCEGKCDENCKECNAENGECNECKSSYYIDPEDKTKCLSCPENCLGECPNGICQECKDTFFGEICDQNCPEKCINKKCDKTTGKCECINHYSTESNCTQCDDFYDIKTECQECINHYDREYDCLQCKTNYDINTSCTECLNHYSFKDNCEKCIQNYDISKNCSECLNYFDIDKNCEICLLGYFGTNCDKECYKGCNLNISNCHQKDGKCDNCISGFFNEFCSETCNENCIGEPPCDPKTGYCEKCKDIYYGDHCEYKTNVEHCIKVNKTNGKCLECNNTYYLTTNNNAKNVLQIVVIIYVKIKQENAIVVQI